MWDGEPKLFCAVKAPVKSRSDSSEALTAVGLNTIGGRG